VGATSEEIAAIIDEETRGAVWRRIEGNFDLDASLCAEEVNPLIGNQLRAAGEDCLTLRDLVQSLGSLSVIGNVASQCNYAMPCYLTAVAMSNI